MGGEEGLGFQGCAWDGKEKIEGDAFYLKRSKRKCKFDALGPALTQSDDAAAAHFQTVGFGAANGG